MEVGFETTKIKEKTSKNRHNYALLFAVITPAPMPLVPLPDSLDHGELAR